MKKFQIIFFFFFLIVHSGSHAQDRSQKALSIHWGTSKINRQDLVFSPFKHTDRTLFHGGIVFNLQKKFYHEFNVGISQYDPMLVDPYIFYEYDDPQTAYPHQFTLISLDYSIAKPIFEVGKAKILLGGLLKNNVQSLNYNYGRISNFGYFASTGIGLYASYLQQIGEKFRLSAAIKLPLISWLSRSPYLVNDDEFIENIASHNSFKTFTAFIEDGNFASLKSFQSFDLITQYHYRLTTHFELGLKNEIIFLHARRPRNLYSLQTGTSLNIRFTF